jgi:hypothetical protein
MSSRVIFASAVPISGSPAADFDKPMSQQKSKFALVGYPKHPNELDASDAFSH